MGIIGSLLRPLAATWAPDDDRWYAPLTPLSQAGVPVNPETALRLAAVWACVRIIAETVATVPLPVYERLSDGGKERVRRHPLYDVLHDRPNRWQTSFEWREMMTGHAVLRGNAFSRIVPGPRGPVDQLIPLHPDRVRVEQLDNGDLRYEVRRQDGTTYRLLQDEMFHLRGLSSDGISGLALTAYAQESFGTALAAEGYAARFYSQDGSPGGVLETEATLGPTAYQNLTQSWKQAHTGPKGWHQPAILEQGLKWHQIGLSPEDAMLIDQKKWSVADCARWFRMPPHMIGDHERGAAYASVEQQALDFVVFTMTPWFVRWEQRLNSDLVLAPQRFFVEFLLDGLLRGDIESRYKAYAVGRNWGWLSANDVRRSENMNPIEDGDEYLRPLNMTPLGEEAGAQPGRTRAEFQQFAKASYRRNGSHEV